MILDSLLTFTAASGNTDSPTTGTQYSTNIIDLGISGLPNSAAGGGARDLGVGDAPALKIHVDVTTAFVSGTSLQILLQGAPDNGSGAPGSYTTMFSGAVVAEASLVIGARLADIDVPRVVPGQPIPRYLRLAYVTVGTHTAGAIEGNIVLDRFDQLIGTGGALSGYPAGITVAN